MKFKKNPAFRLFCLLLVGSLLSFSLAACSSGGGSGSSGDSGGTTDSGNSSSSGETIKLSFSHHDAATSAWGIYFEDWAARVGAESNCEITVYAGSTLAAAGDGLQALRTGVCDILWTNMAFFPGQFPVTEGTILPMIGNNATAQEYTEVLWDLWEDETVGQALRDEWSEFKVLILHGSPGFPLGLASEGRVPADIAGRSIRAPAGGLTDLMNAIGANPVLTPSGDIYTSMDKGIIEGYLLDFCGVEGFKLDEVTDYIIDLNVMNQFMLIVMTQERFDSLPDDVKAAMENNSGRENSIAFAEITQAASDEMRSVFEESGRLIVPTEEEYALWEEAAVPVQEQWIENNTSDSFDAQAFYDKLIELVGQYTA